MNTNKQINIMILLVFVAVFLTGAYTIWDPDRADTGEERQLEAVTERGAWLFSQNCRTCHGDQGEGGAASNRLRAAPPLNRPDLQGREEAGGEVDEAAKRQAYKLVFDTITCGRVGKAMPVWGIEHGGTLNDEQIRQLATLITEGGEGWEHARELAMHGVPEFGKHGDLGDLSLAEAVSESDTELVLNGEVSVLSPDMRLEFVEIDEETDEVISGELMLITDVDAESRTVTVERGLGTTDGEAHEAGTQLIAPPAPPEPVATVQRSCGQTAGAPVPTGTPDPPSATLEIVAQGIAWNKTRLSAIAGVPLTLTLDNRDPDAHNIHFTEGAEPGGEDVAATEIENGPTTQTLNFGPLEPGDYYYLCDVHPQMEGVLTASAEGEAAGGETEGSAADGATDGGTTDGAPASGTPVP